MTANSVATGDQDAPRSPPTATATSPWSGRTTATPPPDRQRAQRDLPAPVPQRTSQLRDEALGRRHGGRDRLAAPQPDVGLDDRGNAVVVWAEDPDGNGFYNIPYRVVSPRPARSLGSGQANASADGQQIHPRVAVDPDGAPNSTAAVAFTVVWEDIQGTRAATVKAAGFTGPTTKAYEVTVNATGGSHHNPDVAVSASGDAVVVWDEDTDGNGFYNIGLVRLAKANGRPSCSRRSANTIGGGQQHARCRGGRLQRRLRRGVGVRPHRHPGVWARSFTATGAAGHAEVEVPAAAAERPSVGIDDQPTRWSAGASPAADPASGPAASTPTAPSPAGCRPSRQPGHDRPAGADRGRGLAVRRSGRRLHRRQRRQHLRPGAPGHWNLEQQFVMHGVAGETCFSTASRR